MAAASEVLADARKAIDEARQHGLTPQQVLALVAHFRERPGAWGGGALHWRIRAARPEWRANEKWPPASAEWLARQKAQAAAAACVRDTAEQDQRRAAVAEEREAARQAERLWGERLDALAGSDREALLDELPPMLRAMREAWPLVGLAREAAIDKLAQRAAAGAWLAGMHGARAGEAG